MIRQILADISKVRKPVSSVAVLCYFFLPKPEHVNGNWRRKYYKICKRSQVSIMF